MLNHGEMGGLGCRAMHFLKDALILYYMSNSTAVLNSLALKTKDPGAKRSDCQNQVFEKIKKQSLEPRYLNFRAIIVAKGVFSNARIIRDAKS